MEGFIQLHRKIFEWEWYTDIVVKSFFIHCLLKANFKDKEWRGLTIKRGQFLTSLHNLSVETGLSVKQVRRAIDALILTKEIGKETTSLNTLITVNYYEKYQSEGKAKANKGQTKGKQRATTNNDNNDNKEIYSFEDFWNDYDNKTGKEKSLQLWNKLTDNEKLRIKNTVKQFKSYKPFEDYTHPMPATYLNQKRFNDEITINKEPKEDVRLYIKNHLTYGQLIGEEAVQSDKYPEYSGLYYIHSKDQFQKEKP